MNPVRISLLWTLLTVSSAGHWTAPVAAAEIEFLGRVSLPGDATDLSGITDPLADGTPHNQLGGFSAIEYDARRGIYLVLSDRGPGDGAVAYQCRFHEVELSITPGSEIPVTARLLATRMLRDEQGRPLIGLASEIRSGNSANNRRFDPEGIRVGLDGTIYISDEYGPHLYAFSPEGQLERRIAVPRHLSVQVPHWSPDEEHRLNRTGRQSNRGWEGLAISADGKTLYPMLQGPLLQDHPFDPQGERLGRLVRFFEIPVTGQPVREWAYQLEDAGHGISEVTLIEGRRFLVLERDNKGGTSAKCKCLYEADFSKATNVSGGASLPVETLPSDQQTANKRLYLDLLNPQFGLAGEEFPPKIEGVTFGPKIPDERRLLIICSDNDFQAAQASWFYVFAVADARVTR